MAREWDTIGEGANRKHRLTITTQGRNPQVYIGKSKAEIAEQLAHAQEHATEHIVKLSSREPEAPAVAAPKQLEPSERMQMVSDITNPAKVDEAFTRLVETTVGAPISDIRKAVAKPSQDERETAAITAAKSFAENTPDWFASPHNNNLLVDFMQAQNMDPTDRDAYVTAFGRLKAAGLLQKAPERTTDDEPEPQRIAENKPVPTRYSTGVRPSEMGGSSTTPARRFKWTREEIDQMSAARYKQLMQSDPDFSKAVDFYAQPQRRTA